MRHSALGTSTDKLYPSCMPRLLLADDSVTIQRVIELTFAEEGVEVVSVGDGQQAIERLAREKFDVVLADVGMPGIDGYAVAAHVQQRPELAGLPVVLLTGAFDAVDQVRVNDVKAAGVLAKPFEPQMVIAKVRELLGGAPAPVAATPAAQPSSTSSPEDYFDRLDRAFASLTPTLEPRSAPPKPAASEPSAASPAATEAPSAPTAAAGAASQQSPRTASDLADTFATLLAVETGELPPSALLPPPEAGDEALVERVARRVVAEMGEGPLRQLAADIVSRTAERLVREEIERIKAEQ
jgi:CheY-like chemotaxis protein